MSGGDNGVGGKGLPSIFGTAKTSAFSTHAQSRFASAVLDSVPHPIVCLFTYSSGGNTRGESTKEPLRGTVSAQKALHVTETGSKDLLGGTEENSVAFPCRGVIDLPSRNLNHYFTSLILLAPSLSSTWLCGVIY